MKTYSLDWKGWWLLRSTMSDAPELQSGSAIYAVMAAKLRKVEKGIVCAAREPVLFSAHKGGPLREHLQKMLRGSLGVFAIKRCQEIRKQPIIYVATLPADIDLGEMAAILSLMYGSVPFAPRHHAMPPAYDGEPMRVFNAGRPIGLPSEITHGIAPERDADRTADIAMAHAMAQEASATLIVQPGNDPGSLATERLSKPPSMIETEKVDKEGMPRGLATERIDRPPAGPGDTEFVPRPEGEADSPEEGTEIIGEANHSAGA